jgi:phosphatidate cytidylyltransferase
MFVTRLATAVVLLAGFIAALFLLPGDAWLLLLLFPLAIAAWEWAALAGYGRTGRLAFMGVIAGSALLIGFATAVLPAGVAPVDRAIYGAGAAFWLLIALPWVVRRWQAKSALAMGIAGWLALVPACLALARLQVEPAKLLALLGVVWISDTAAYLAGRAWGRHKLAPAVSPGKTWEGVAGAVAGVAVYYVALSVALPGWSWWQGYGGAVLFAGVMAAGVLGDLFESWIKRQAGAKDSGTLLPGHGGVLDRIDSMTACLPIAALLIPLAG